MRKRKGRCRAKAFTAEAAENFFVLRLLVPVAVEAGFLVPDFSLRLRRSLRFKAAFGLPGEDARRFIFPQLDLFFGELHLQRQRAGDAVGQVGQSNQHVQVDNLLVGEMFL